MIHQMLNALVLKDDKSNNDFYATSSYRYDDNDVSPIILSVLLFSEFVNKDFVDSNKVPIELLMFIRKIKKF